MSDYTDFIDDRQTEALDRPTEGRYMVTDTDSTFFTTTNEIDVARDRVIHEAHIMVKNQDNPNPAERMTDFARDLALLVDTISDYFDVQRSLLRER